MNASYLPLFGKQRAQREEIASLKTQVETMQEQLEGVQENLKNCVAYLEETVQPLIEDQAKLSERITALLEQCHNFQARNADLEDEIARLKHKKLPSREKV